MIRKNTQEYGFSLIEMIMTMILLGLLMMFANMGMTSAAKSVMITRDSVDMAMRAEFALSRITRELTELKDVTEHTATVFRYQTQDERHNLEIRSDQTLYMGWEYPSASAPPLLDNVTDFSVKTFKGLDGSAWKVGDDIKQLSAIEVSFTLTGRQSGFKHTFTRLFVPRNNGNTGGAPTTGTDNKYSSKCVATVAAPYSPGGPGSTLGNEESHRPAQTLRRFRDQYLMTWEGGRALTAMYYKASAPVADAIRDSESARAVVWQMVKAAALVAGLIMDAPLLFAAILLMPLLWRGRLSIIKNFGRSIHMLQPRWHYSREASINQHALNSGSVLLVIIGALVAFSSMAALVLALMSSGLEATVTVNRGDQAYYLAESGYNVLAAKYKKLKTPLEKEDLLEESNKSTYNLDENQKFTVTAIPYWFRNLDDDGTTLKAHIPGTPPDISRSNLVQGRNKSGVYIRIGTGTNYRPVESIQVTPSGDSGTVTFKALSPTSLAKSSDRIFLAMKIDAGSTPSKLDRLVLTRETITLFPPKYGAFSVYINGKDAPYDGSVLFTYGKRDDDSGELWEVKDSRTGDPAHMRFYDPDVFVTLEPFAKVNVTGFAVDGSNRMISFNTPINDLFSAGDDFAKEKVVISSSDFGANMFGEINGSFSTSAGNGLTFNNTSTTTDLGVARVKPAVSKKSMTKAWRDSGGALSYDVQVKVNGDRHFLGGAFVLGNGDDTDGKKYNYIGVGIMRTYSESDYMATKNFSSVIGSINFYNTVLNGTAWDKTKDGAYAICLNDKGHLPMLPLVPNYNPADELSSPIFTNRQFNYEFKSTYPYVSARYCDPAKSQKETVYGLARRLSQPALVMWLQEGDKRTLLAWKRLGNVSTVPAETDGFYGSINTESMNIRNATRMDWGEPTTITTTNYALKPWNTMLVRVTEGLGMSYDGASTSGLKYGDVLYQKGEATKTARLNGQAVLSTNNKWGLSSAGMMTFGNYINVGTGVAQPPLGTLGSGSADVAKNVKTKYTPPDSKNQFLRVYLGSPGTVGRPNNNPVDLDNRLQNPWLNESSASVLARTLVWIPDDYSDWTEYNDNYTLVEWEGINTEYLEPVTSTGTEFFDLGSSMAAGKNTVLRLKNEKMPAGVKFMSPALRPGDTTQEVDSGVGVIGYMNVTVSDFGLQMDMKGSSGGNLIIPPVRN